MFRENFHDFVFNKERLHNVVAIENFGPFIDTNLALPKNFQGEWRNFHRPRTLFLACQILDSASLIILYVHKHGRLGFWMLTVETAIFDSIWWFSSSDGKGPSYLVKYCLELVEEYSEGKIHKGEPETLNGNVNTVYFIN